MTKEVLLITGASRGLGAATAIQAAEKGYAVCVNYLNNHEAADDIVSTIKAKGGEAIAVAANIADEQEVMKLFETVDDQLGKITALVNNAGIAGKLTTVENMDAARLQCTFATNVIAYFICAREAIKRMAVKYGGKGGSIVNISSTAARLGSANSYVDYAASKGAVDTECREY
ncbi:MAG: SDR family NAD(P)-dependent oxidoreductase [Pseudomonadota bacterium]